MSLTADSDLFHLAPIAMWIEDFSEVKKLFDRWRSEGVRDIRGFLREDVSRVATCSSSIRVMDVNKQTLEMFEASDIDELRPISPPSSGTIC